MKYFTTFSSPKPPTEAKSTGKMKNKTPIDYTNGCPQLPKTLEATLNKSNTP